MLLGQNTGILRSIAHLKPPPPPKKKVLLGLRDDGPMSGDETTEKMMHSDAKQLSFTVLRGVSLKIRNPKKILFSAEYFCQFSPK